jgi:hypothetical protein
MITRLDDRKEMHMFLKIAALLFCVAIIVYACQNKRPSKTMSEKKLSEQPADTDRLLSVANLEQTEGGQKVIAWFFETPQIFEFSLGSEQAQSIFNLLKEAKEKQVPVNVRSTFKQDKNIIDLVIPATEAQMKRYNKEKAQRQQPDSIPPPPHR